MTSLTASLVAFVIYGGLSLGLGLSLTYISRREIVTRLSLVILIISTRFVLLGEPVAL